MSVGVSILADRFRQEPLDGLGYDRWMDGEGLLDASDECRAAWRKFGPVWRAAREDDLGRVAGRAARAELEAGMSTWERYGLGRLREWGAWYGTCSAARARPISADAVAAGFAWLRRVNVFDGDLADDLWRLLRGEPLALVAREAGLSDSEMLGRARVACRWMVSELQAHSKRDLGYR